MLFQKGHHEVNALLIFVVFLFIDFWSPALSRWVAGLPCRSVRTVIRVYTSKSSRLTTPELQLRHIPSLQGEAAPWPDASPRNSFQLPSCAAADPAADSCMKSCWRSSGAATAGLCRKHSSANRRILLWGGSRRLTAQAHSTVNTGYPILNLTPHVLPPLIIHTRVQYRSDVCRKTKPMTAVNPDFTPQISLISRTEATGPQRCRCVKQSPESVHLWKPPRKMQEIPTKLPVFFKTLNPWKNNSDSQCRSS